MSPVALGASVVLGADALVTTALGSAMAPSTWTGPMAGLIFAAHFAGVCLAILRADRMAATRGQGAMLLLSVATLLVTTLLLPLLPLFLAWVVLRFLAGAAVGGVLFVGGARLAGRTGALRFVLVAQLTAAAIQPVLAVYGPGHVETFVLAGALIAAGAGLMLGGRRDLEATEPLPEPAAGKALGEIELLAAAGSFGAGAALATLLAFGPVWAYGIGLNVASTGIFMALVLLGGLGQVPLTRLLRRLDPRIALALVAWALAIVSVGFAFSVSRSFLLAAPLALVSGALAFAMHPIAWAYAEASTAPDRQRNVARSSALLCALGGVGGSLFTSLAMLPSVLGPAGLAVGLGLLAATVAGVAVFHRLTRTDESRGVIAPIPVTVPAALPAELVLRTAPGEPSPTPGPVPPPPGPPPPAPNPTAPMPPATATIPEPPHHGSG